MNPFEPFGRVDEKPLDYLLTDGGFSAIFRTIGCVGDSMSSGEFETVDENGVKLFHDVFCQSWGQYLARMNGAKVYNFSAGGMTAKEYCTLFAYRRGYWNRDLACQAYIISLGGNDLLNFDHPLGTMEDIDLENWRNNAPTFTGYYAQIIQRLKEIQPEAKFFLMTMARSTKGDEQKSLLRQQHADRLHELAACFSNCYLMDFHKYGPVYDQRFRDLYFLMGHMNPCGYLLVAKMVASYMDYIIRHHMEDFKHIGLV